MISPVCRSSARSTGQPDPSALASSNSTFVPMILYLLFSGSMEAKSDMDVLYDLLSEVCRSRSIVVGFEKEILDLSLLTFLR